NLKVAGANRVLLRSECGPAPKIGQLSDGDLEPDTTRLGAAGLDRRTVCSPAPRKMSVERRCDAADQEPELCAISYGKPGIVNQHDPICNKAVYSRTIDDGELRIQTVTTGCL
ncbi:hypothetical protein, partial [Bradyrhizobium sp. CCBAU 45394]|uniref:hypothetical protein n=1 Tax=Bradyrhizobium sp. CCBAU 45394 TaxID=1325087 RepID=UPI0023023ABB